MSHPKNRFPLLTVTRALLSSMCTMAVPVARSRLVHGSDKAQHEYERLLARLRAVPAHVITPHRPDLTVNELVLAYTRWTEKNRTPDRQPNRGGTSPRFALRTLRELFGMLPISDAGHARRCSSDRRPRHRAND